MHNPIYRILAVIIVIGPTVVAPALRAQHPPAAKLAKGEPRPEESQLSREIRHQLLVLPYYSVFDYLTFTLDADKVTISGYVLRPTLRSNAEAAIKSLEGVSSVKNLVEVLPKSPTDDDSRRAVYRAIFEDSTLQRYAVSEVPLIHIILKNGEVTLAGSVASEAEKNLASARASNVSGISGVKNNLSIRSKGAPAN
ncbi:MAG TPA: BON domain-containing protein [Candidatus Acidoferrales bacterium]|jgi:hyperosmotically inducible protein|nr:BON domain-containing protein [Candidatus Acidoferrales bacterium]